MAGKRALVVNSSVLDVGGLLILYIMNDIRLVLKVRKKTREDGALTHLMNEIGEVWRRAKVEQRHSGLPVFQSNLSVADFVPEPVPAIGTPWYPEIVRVHLLQRKQV